MLNSAKDQAIKRYLSKVGTLERNSKLYKSRYYKVEYSKDLEIIIRFSDHFNSETKTKSNINIIKTTNNLYIIKSVITITLRENEILPYLKSLLLLFPEIYNTCKSYQQVADIAEKEIIKANTETAKVVRQLDTYKEEFNEVHIAWNENKSLKGENRALGETIKVQKQQYAEQKVILKELQNKCDVIQNKLNKIKNLLYK